MKNRKLKVLVVDDSALIRQVLKAIIDSQPDMEVVATAANPVIARDRIRELSPDVLTLDVEMPLMSGLEFLEKLMVARPMPVLMVSTLTERGSALALRALELGAVDFVSKPRIGIQQGLNDYAAEICGKIRIAAQARPFAARAAPKILPTTSDRETRRTAPGFKKDVVVFVGASTGGTEAIRVFLSAMPRDCPPVLIAQHMPEHFTRSFAQRLDSQTDLNVCEAAPGQTLHPGHAYVAPGHSHLLLARGTVGYATALSDADPVNRHRPSVDVLFHSAARLAGSSAVGVILTGMGRDGAAGMLAMRQAGAATFAQDEKSCVVYGMPREAVAIGGADETVSLERMAEAVMKACSAEGRARSQ